MCVASDVGVKEGEGPGVFVTWGTGVLVGVSVGSAVGEALGVRVGFGVRDGFGVAVAAGTVVEVGVDIGVLVAVGVGLLLCRSNAPMSHSFEEGLLSPSLLRGLPRWSTPLTGALLH